MTRPFLVAAAEALEQTLRRNDGKPCWSGLSLADAWTLLQEEVDELQAEVQSAAIHPHSIRLEALDVAAVALMIWANAGGLAGYGHRGMGKDGAGFPG